MYRDMTRGSITQGLLLFALPMAAGDPCDEYGTAITWEQFKEAVAWCNG